MPLSNKEEVLKLDGLMGRHKRIVGFATWLGDFWSHILLVGGAILLAVSAGLLIYNSGDWSWDAIWTSNYSIILIIGAWLSFIGGLGGFGQQTTVTRLVQKVSESRSQLNHVNQLYSRNLHYQLAVLSEELGYKETEVISVYKYLGDGQRGSKSDDNRPVGQFRRIGLYSKNPFLQEGVDKTIESRQKLGFISLAWEKGEIFKEDAPNPETEADKYWEWLHCNFDIEKDTGEKFMLQKSRSFAAFSISYPTMGQAGVIVFESKKPVEVIDHEYLKKIMETREQSRLSYFFEMTKSLFNQLQLLEYSKQSDA